MSIRIVNTLPEDEWRAFVGKHPQGNIFHTPEMFHVFSRTKGNRPQMWVAIEDDRILAMLLPVQITLKDGLLRPLTTRAVVYGSVLCAPGLEGQEALGVLLQLYKREVKGSPLFTEMRNVSDYSYIQPILSENGFIYEEHLNFWVDLRQKTDEIWNRLDPNAKSNVKKAQKKGVIIEEAVSPDTVRISYTLLKEVYSRIHVPLADYSLFQTSFDILQPKGMVKFFMARTGDIYIGTSIVLLYKDLVFGWYAGASQKYSSYKAGDMLNWHVLEWGAQNNRSGFDFGGAGKPSEDYGPRRFKAKFGGLLVNYGRNIYVHAPTRLKLTILGYQLLRKFL